MSEVIIIGLDIAKYVFHVHGADERGRVIFSKRISRGKSVTLQFRSRSASVSQETTLWVPPYNLGGTLSARGAASAMRIKRFPAAISVRAADYFCYPPDNRS